MGMRAFLFSSSAAALASVPFAVFAAETSFFGPIIPQIGECVCEGSAMDWGCVLVVAQGFLGALVSFGVLAVVFYIGYAGFTLITSGGNPATRTKAKNRMLSAVVGLAVILGAFLIVDTVMKILYNPDTALESGTFGPWNEIFVGGEENYCVAVNMNPGVLNDGSVADIISNALNPGTTTSSTMGGGTAPSGSGAPSSAGGRCQVKTSGPCATSNFTAAFGAAAGQASQICSAESGNGTLLEGDRTTSGKPVSFGLFQINITAHPVAGLQCPKAFDRLFTGSNKNVKILDADLYQKCRTAALNSSNNAAVAAKIFKGDKNSWRQWSTRRTCGLP